MGYTLDVDTPKLMTIGSVSVLLLAAILLRAHGYFLKAEYDEFVAKHYNTVNPELEALRRQHGANLHSFKLIQASPGTVQIPIDHAMQIMIETRGNPPATQPLGRP